MSLPRDLAMTFDYTHRALFSTACQDYPNVPPLMELETTGGGVARFNPNLVSLLGLPVERTGWGQGAC